MTVFKLPQSTRQNFNASAAGDQVAVTYYGPDELSTMTRKEFNTHVIVPTRQTRVATLVQFYFGWTNATVVTYVDIVNFDGVLEFSWLTIVGDIKTTYCPGWAHRPLQVFDSITQVHTDNLGNITISTVQVYAK